MRGAGKSVEDAASEPGAAVVWGNSQHVQVTTFRHVILAVWEGEMRESDVRVWVLRERGERGRCGKGSFVR